MINNERAISNAMLGVIGGVGVLVALGLLVYLLAFLGDADDDDGALNAQDVYVSVGDSVAAGYGASDPASTSFAALIAAEEDLSLYNVAKANVTTRQVIDEQLPDVLPILGSGRVRLITISAGGNDLAALIPNASCVEEPLRASCPLDSTLAGVADRLDEMLRLLRDANPNVPIVILGYPNFFAGTDHAWEAPAAAVLPLLTDTMQTVASKYERVSVATPAFRGQQRRPLTHVLDTPFDPHPNDAGHRIIADAMLEALNGVR
jgi:lysophospholipase L1-like esterase